MKLTLPLAIRQHPYRTAFMMCCVAGIIWLFGINWLSTAGIVYAMWLMNHDTDLKDWVRGKDL